MNKRELGAKVADKVGLTQAQADQAVEATFEALAGALAAGEKVQLGGFGTFEVRERAARTGRNPQTGEEIQIAASKAAGFKPATALKTRLNG